MPARRAEGHLAGKVAIVSGASSGIGKATAMELTRRGAAVVLAARNREKLEATAKEIETAGGTACAVLADVAKAGDHCRIMAITLDRYGRLDYAVNNAGIPGRKQFMEASSQEFSEVLATNVGGIFLAMPSQIPVILNSGGGAIVNTASVGGLVGVPNLSMYMASKHAVIGVTKSVALEYAAKGLRINCVAPGSTDTPMLAGVTQEQHEIRTNAAPMRRVSDPLEQAIAIIYLLVDATFSTGIVLSAELPPSEWSIDYDSLDQG